MERSVSRDRWLTSGTTWHVVLLGSLCLPLVDAELKIVLGSPGPLVGKLSSGVALLCWSHNAVGKSRETAGRGSQLGRERPHARSTGWNTAHHAPTAWKANTKQVTHQTGPTREPVNHAHPVYFDTCQCIHPVYFLDLFVPALRNSKSCALSLFAAFFSALLILLFALMLLCLIFFSLSCLIFIFAASCALFCTAQRVTHTAGQRADKERSGHGGTPAGSRVQGVGQGLGKAAKW